jgi:hypothetical protein
MTGSRQGHRSCSAYRHYFAGTGWLSKIELRIMNKYLAGLFKNISTVEFRIQKSGCCTRAGVEEIVILCRRACPDDKHRTYRIPVVFP